MVPKKSCNISITSNISDKKSMTISNIVTHLWLERVQNSQYVHFRIQNYDGAIKN